MPGLAIVRDIAIVLGGLCREVILPVILLLVLSSPACKSFFVGRASKSPDGLDLPENQKDKKKRKTNKVLTSSANNILRKLSYGRFGGISDQPQPSRDIMHNGFEDSNSHEARSLTSDCRERCWVCTEWQFYEENSYTGIIRVPLSLRLDIHWTLHREMDSRRQDDWSYGGLRRDDEERYGGLEGAWMNAIARRFPRDPLLKLRYQDPSLLPLCLLQGFSKFQDMLVLQRKGIFAEETYGSPRCGRKTQLCCLAATSQCRFQEGFASEGMLCNDPPIPLRVLDFLESSTDLLNLARVCKATHQAGHVLLQREFPGGLGELRQADLPPVIARRKRDTLEFAMRRPIPSRAASASSQAPKASGAEASTASGTEDSWGYTRMIYANDVVDCILLTLLEAGHVLKPGYAEHIFCSYNNNTLSYVLGEEMRYGLTLDWEAVKRAVAMLGDRSHCSRIYRDLDHEDAVERVWNWRNGRGSNAEGLVRILQAAKREGHGVIVLRNMPEVTCSCKLSQQGHDTGNH